MEGLSRTYRCGPLMMDGFVKWWMMIVMCEIPCEAHRGRNVLEAIREWDSGELYRGRF